MSKKKVTGKEKKPFYKRWWFIALMVILVIGAIGGSDDEEEIEAEEPDTEEVAEAEQEKVSENTENETDEEETEQDEKQKEDISELEEILLQEGHPYYGGNTADAEEYAKNYDKKIISLNKNDWSEESILHIPIRRGNDVIKSLEIYLNPLNESPNEEQVLNLVQAYLPDESMLEKYEDPVFKQYSKKEDDTKTNKHIHYSSKEDAEDTLGAIHVILYEENGVINNIQFTSMTPNSISTRGSTSLEENDWDNNF